MRLGRFEGRQRCGVVNGLAVGEVKVGSRNFGGLWTQCPLKKVSSVACRRGDRLPMFCGKSAPSSAAMERRSTAFRIPCATSDGCLPSDLMLTMAARRTFALMTVVAG